jgi:hypothetical protein
MATRRQLIQGGTALAALRALPAWAAPASARTVRIGVLNDQSSLYADIGGPGSVVAARLAMADSGLAARGWTTEVLVADHQNKPDLAAGIARQWFDSGVDAVADVTNSAAALSVSQIGRDKDKVVLVSGAATSDLTGVACSPNTVHWTHDTWAFANAIGKGVVRNLLESGNTGARKHRPVMAGFQRDQRPAGGGGQPPRVTLAGTAARLSRAGSASAHGRARSAARAGSCHSARHDGYAGSGDG